MDEAPCTCSPISAAAARESIERLEFSPFLCPVHAPRRSAPRARRRPPARSGSPGPRRSTRAAPARGVAAVLELAHASRCLHRLRLVTRRRTTRGLRASPGAGPVAARGSRGKVWQKPASARTYVTSLAPKVKRAPNAAHTGTVIPQALTVSRRSPRTVSRMAVRNRLRRRLPRRSPDATGAPRKTAAKSPLLPSLRRKSVDRRGAE